VTRTAIQASISGTIMNVKVTTQTGVITAGQPILEIVPVEAKLIIDARLKPNDIDVGQSEMRAGILLTAIASVRCRRSSARCVPSQPTD